MVEMGEWAVVTVAGLLKRSVLEFSAIGDTITAHSQRRRNSSMTIRYYLNRVRYSTNRAYKRRIHEMKQLYCLQTKLWTSNVLAREGSASFPVRPLSTPERALLQHPLLNTYYCMS
jgi:hypothetical protein